MGRPDTSDLTRFVDVVTKLWDEEECRDLGFLARVFAQTSLPYKDPGDVPRWSRRNGDLTLTIQAGEAGYPYGSIPRLLLVWLSTEALRTKSRELTLGDSLADFMRQLGLISNGKHIKRLHEQMDRLFEARVMVRWTPTAGRTSFEQVTIADGARLWWDEKAPEQTSLVPSVVRLSERFYDEIVERPVPLDMVVLRKFKNSPMRLDLYAWLTYRMSYLSRRTTVSWDQLMFQLGSNAASERGRRKFRADVKKHLGEILREYPEARIEASDIGITLRPSAPHVSRGNRPMLASASTRQTPAPASADEYCVHGGEPGTLPDGQPRCPSCRR